MTERLPLEGLTIDTGKPGTTFHPPTGADNLPGMWERADFMDGEAAQPVQDLGEAEHLRWWAERPERRREPLCGEHLAAAAAKLDTARRLAHYYQNVASTAGKRADEGSARIRELEAENDRLALENARLIQGLMKQREAGDALADALRDPFGHGTDAVLDRWEQTR